MSSAQIEIQVIASIVAVACALPGTFLVLRKMALITDAISHAILPGIVIGFFILHDLSSPWLIILAACSGLCTVLLVERIQKTGLVKEDTAIGLVFPAMFSIGIILITKHANDVHLDVDAVLLGELAFAPFDRLWIGQEDWGPKSFWVIGSILMITLILIITFFKELKISTFDSGLAAAVGLSPVWIHYGLMGMVSITTVGAFDAVGAILVISLMIAPPATAYLLTHDLQRMLILASLFGISAAIAGYWLANYLDSSISGAITTVLGGIFFGTYIFAPNKGLVSTLYKQKRQRVEVMLLTFLLHINNHHELEERHVQHLRQHINWQKVRADSVLQLALSNNMIQIHEDIVLLTEKGKQFTKEAISCITTNKKSEIEFIKDRFFLFRG